MHFSFLLRARYVDQEFSIATLYYRATVKFSFRHGDAEWRRACI